MTPQAAGQPLDPEVQLSPPDDRPGTPLLLPPRPNLGPEPWPGPAWGDAATTALVLLILLVPLALGVVGLLLRRDPRRRRRTPGDPGSPAAGSDGTATPAGPDDLRVTRAELLRDALIDAFGPSWAAKTTEEIAQGPELSDRIGPEQAARAVALLGAADRAKFAGEAADEPDAGPGGPPDLGLAGLIEAIRASRGRTARGRAPSGPASPGSADSPRASGKAD